jgi:hypothetical protein
MSLSRADLVGKWHASPEVDEFFQTVEFREDGTGMVQSAGGQALCLFANFGWALEEGARISLRFEETSLHPWAPYTPDDDARTLTVRCDLEVGEFALRVPAIRSTVTFRRRLRFDESPLPKDAAKYHAHSLFFSVVNQIDPRQFLVFYARAKKADIAPDPERTRPHWSEMLAKADELTLARFPGESAKMFEGRQWIRVVAANEFVLEACVLGGGSAPIERVDWFLPGTKTVVAEASISGPRALALRVGGILVGEVAQQDGCLELRAADARPLAREQHDAPWRSQFKRSDGLTLATRSPAIPTLERFGSEVGLAADCTEVDRVLLVLACLVALDRDTTSKQ